MLPFDIESPVSVVSQASPSGNNYIGNIVIPIITFIVVIGVSVKVILSSGLRAIISAIIYFFLIALYMFYRWKTNQEPMLTLYTYILDGINDKKLLWWSFFSLIFIIQYFMLFDFSIKNMSRSFSPESFSMCLSLCLLCNILLSMNAVSQGFATVEFNKLKNPGFSTLIMMGIFIITFFIMLILRKYTSI
jgi:hypothetical protein